MLKETFLALALVLLFVQTGCSLVRELKEDPAIVGATGFNLIIGLDIAPSSVLPTAKVHMNYGATFRVGAHECVYISTSGGASVQTVFADSAKAKDAQDTQAKADAAQDDANKKQQAADEAKKATDAVNPPDPTLKAKSDQAKTDAEKAKTDAGKSQNVADQAQAKANPAVSAPCIPGNTQGVLPVQSGPNAGAGGAGSANLIISANGLEALKARWHQNAQLDLLIGALKDDKLTPAQLESILKQLGENTKAAHRAPSSLPASQK